MPKEKDGHISFEAQVCKVSNHREGGFVLTLQIFEADFEAAKILLGNQNKVYSVGMVEKP